MEEGQPSRPCRGEAGDLPDGVDERYSILSQSAFDLKPKGGGWSLLSREGAYANKKKIIKAQPTITANATQRPHSFQELRQSFGYPQEST